MDSFEINKILGAVLFTLLVVMSLGIAAEAIYAPSVPEKPGFVIEVAEAPAASGAATAEAQDPPVATLLASASADTGATIAKKCAACHNFAEGAGIKVGPDLYNVVGRAIGSFEGFKYSAIFQKAHDAGDKWTYDHLYHFLKKPSADMPGTAMGFAGLPKPQDRADVIAYLRTLSASPEPLPAPEAAPAAPAAGDAAAPAKEPATESAREGAAPAPAAGSEAPSAPADNAAAPAPAAPAAEGAAPAAPAPAAPAAEGAAPAPAAPAANDAVPATPAAPAEPAKPAAP